MIGRLIQGLTVFVVTTLLATGCGRIETGNVGVRKNFNGTIADKVEGEGFYTSIVGSVAEYTLKEIPIDLENLTPKAADNLSLQDLDVTVRYLITDAASVRHLVATKTNSSVKLDGVYLPGFSIVKSAAQSEIADVVSKVDSMVIHQKRGLLESEAKAAMQRTLDASDPGKFKVTQVIVRQVTTDASVEAAIRNVVAKGKEKEAADLNVAIAEKNAEATAKTASTLTPAFLQHEYNQVLMAFAKNGGSATLILDGSANGKVLHVGK